MDHTEISDPDGFQTLVDTALAGIPEPFGQAARSLAIRVVDLPPPHILRDLDIDDPMDLTGLYDGIPLTEKSSFDQPHQPDTIWLFRLPILDEWRNRGDQDLQDLVTHVLVHELAHHFGWSDDDIASVDEWWL